MAFEALHLENRGAIRLTGPDNRSLLQGLVTNDVEQASPENAVYTALLTPQGKFMFDMIVFVDGDDLLLDVEAERKPDLLRRLMMYKLRAEVEIVDEQALSVWASFERPTTEATHAADPRDPRLGWRTIATSLDAAPLSNQAYEEARIALGIPDGSRDMQVEKYFWLETAAERLNGVSFTKGCFVGQELTARMKHRTTVKKMLTPVKVEGGADADAPIETTDGKTAGDVRTTNGDYAIVYLRQEHLEAELRQAGKTVTVLSVE